MLQVIAVERRLALFLQAQHRVQLAARLARQDGAQELHVGGRHFHIHHEVGAREREQDLDLLAFRQHGVEHELAVAVVQDRHDECQLLLAVDRLADNVSALVTEEEARQDLELRVRRQIAEEGRKPLLDQGHVAAEVGELGVQLEVRDDPPQRERHAVHRGIVDAVSGRQLLRLDVFGGDDGAHEDELVVEIAAVQDVAADGVEERLRQFRPLVPRQHADVMELQLAPDGVGQVVGSVFVLQLVHALLHAAVVKADPLARRRLRHGPLAPLEVALGILAGLAEQPVMLVEAVEDRARDIERDLRGQQFREGGLGHGFGHNG